MQRYIYQQEDWPQFTWDSGGLSFLLGKVRNAQGKLIGKMETLGFELRSEAALETLILDVLKSTEIEGELLNPEQVRSSIARRLGMDIPGLVHSDRDVDGVVEMTLDATRNFEKKLTAERLFDWHAAIFPTGRSGMFKIRVGAWRDDSKGPMQIVSGGMGGEKVHYEAPDAERVEKEMSLFLDWFNSEQNIDPVIKAGLAHFWFVTIHPFEDGNGRIARAIADMTLARSDGIPQRFYSMSSQIRIERNEYYKILELSQKATLDATDWLDWFLRCLSRAIQSSDEILGKTLQKHNFWNKHATVSLNKRQIFMLNKVLNGFDGKVTTSKWAKIAKCSQDTALRDIRDLIGKGILRKEAGGGRSASYELD